ncbi:MAG: pyridoxal phosphate-dependent aminotransferase [Bacteroidetes bacterium]|nr:MAG: pyridoxal phosphate-dependent aminotransferase [Bacteroidota bacterium]TAE65046.1 MAG: pyridoxal phosphate-dependent aminotransferase [Bacteroidota bacterium]TAF94227.1 MAG: pyridoxal phosphate-dependent aminotransferase [Bacteroidota bacterium]
MLFTDAHINKVALQQRAFNLRWATVPEGVIPLTAADPDFMCAPEIVEAIERYSKERTFAYGPPEGLLSFRETISKVVFERKNIKTHAGLVLPVDSAAQGMMVIANTYLQKGDEALVFDPVDFLFKTTVEQAGAKAVLIPVDVATGHFSVAQMEAAITPATKMICLCNPLNPIGKVFSKEELTAIGQLAVKHQVWIMNDEIWSDIIFPEAQFTSIASLSTEIADRTITVYGFSKSFAIAGLRAGFIIAPNQNSYNQLFQASLLATTITGITPLSQVAAQAAFEHCWYWLEAFLLHLTRIRKIGLEMLNQIPGVSCHTPQGCYLVFPNITGLQKTSTEVTEYLFQKAKVAVVPGAAKWFGPGAEGHVRICLATSETIFTEAMQRIQNAVKEF